MDKMDKIRNSKDAKDTTLPAMKAAERTMDGIRGDWPTERDREKRALIAMSGGVDSSVAAYLMKERGYTCVGATMRLFHGKEPWKPGAVGIEDSTDSVPLERPTERPTKRPAECPEKSCCSLDDVEDARQVARRLGMRHYVFNFSDRFEEEVIDRFVAAYEQGRTPNPCIACNRYLKFDKLLLRARELGCACVVTGHYARIEEKDGRFLLKKAADPAKDQSYVLYHLTQEQLAHVCFPLGERTKGEVRELAASLGFVNAQKKDSQDICFVPDGDYAAFIERRTGRRYPEGDYIDKDGRVLGRHRGVIRYTIGQRKGLGIALGEPVYVCAVNPAENTVTLGPEEALFCRTLIAGDVNWIAEKPTGPIRVKAKVRYRQAEQWAFAEPTEDGGMRVVFDEPQRAITPGQSVVLYDGDYVVGGGMIL